MTAFKDGVLDAIEDYLRNILNFLFSDRAERLFLDIFGAALFIGTAFLLLFQFWQFLRTNIWSSYSVLNVIILGEKNNYISVKLLNNLASELPGFVTILNFIPIHIILILAGLACFENKIAVAVFRGVCAMGLLLVWGTLLF